MSAARKLLDDIAVIGATIEPAGDRLILRAGLTAVPADLIIRILQTKAELLDTLAAAPTHQECEAEDWQAFYDERAGILEFDCGFPRPAAEAQAFEACTIEWLNRSPAPSSTGRCAWCGHPSRCDADVLPCRTGPHTWLHSECWPSWQVERQAKAAEALASMGIHFRGNGSQKARAK